MYLFFDMEFTQLVQDTTPISLGIVSEDNKTFYAEFTDYSRELVKADKSGFLKNNVLSNLILKSADDEIFTTVKTQVLGDRKRVAKELLTWLMQFNTVDFVADVGAYDFVLLCQLFGGSMQLPEFIAPSYIELNTLLYKYFGISNRTAFDVSREEIAKYVGDVKTKHNALHDAKICKMICDKYKLLN